MPALISSRVAADHKGRPERHRPQENSGTARSPLLKPVRPPDAAAPAYRSHPANNRQRETRDALQLLFSADVRQRVNCPPGPPRLPPADPAVRQDSIVVRARSLGI